ncbi:MAG: phosphatidylglycerophosphatase A [Pseudomonadota bacterium]
MGLVRPAPGTWGSLCAVVAAFFIQTLWEHYVFLPSFAALCIIGYWAIAQCVKTYGDAPEIVIDEWIGQWVACMFIITPDIMIYGLAFLAFRLFDITKIGFIAKLEALPGAKGIILDDLLAGIYSGLCVVGLQLWLL